MARRKRRVSKTWAGAGSALGWSAMAMGLEASAVIGLRTVKLAKGGRAAKAEARRMVAEKVSAALEWQTLALTGALGGDATTAATRTVRHYAPKVRANLRRLSKG
jgi:hypothetical protein